MSQSLRVESLLADKAVRPSGENAIEVIEAECPANCRISRWLATSNNRMVLSMFLEMIRRPSGESAAFPVRKGVPSLDDDLWPEFPGQCHGLER